MYQQTHRVLLYCGRTCHCQSSNVTLFQPALKLSKKDLLSSDAYGSKPIDDDASQRLVYDYEDVKSPR